MDDDRLTADRYRERAEEIRVIAGTMTHPKTRASLLTVADDYLLMAATREHVSRLGLWLRKFKDSN
jgi:flagellar biogenesis protein FliO